MLLPVAHRAHVFFSQLWSSSIKAALSIPPTSPSHPPSACKAKKGLKRVVLRGRAPATACGVVLITSGRKRGIQTCGTFLFSSPVQKPPTASRMQREGSAVQRRRIYSAAGWGWGKIPAYSLSMPSIDVGHLFSCICS